MRGNTFQFFVHSRSPGNAQVGQLHLHAYYFICILFITSLFLPPLTWIRLGALHGLPLSTGPQSRHSRGGSRRPFLATTSSKPARAKWDSASVRPWIWTLSSHVKAIHVETMLGGAGHWPASPAKLMRIRFSSVRDPVSNYKVENNGENQTTSLYRLHTCEWAHVHERARTHTWVHTCTSIHNNGQELLQNGIRKKP